MEDLNTNINAKYTSDSIGSIVSSEFLHDPSGVVDWKGVLGNCTNILWLRDPVERLVSQIRMISRWTDQEAVNSSHENWMLRDLAREGIKAFLNSPELYAHRSRFNGITYFMQLGDRQSRGIWETQHLSGSKMLQDYAMNVAIKNLYKMDFVGFVERFSESFSSLSRYMNLPYSAYKVALNSNKFATEVDEEELALLRNFVHIDMQVYQHAIKYMKNIEQKIAENDALDGTISFIQRVTGPLVSSIVMPSDDVFVDNWYQCEKNGRQLSRWTGPGSPSRIALHVEKTRNLYFRMILTDLNRSENINDLSIFIDNFKLDFSISIIANSTIVVEGFVNKEDLEYKDRILWISIDCGKPAKSRDPEDERLLGVAVCQIEVGPAEKYSLFSLADIPIE